jgi:hypothetical protein
VSALCSDTLVRVEGELKWISDEEVEFLLDQVFTKRGSRRLFQVPHPCVQIVQSSNWEGA